MRCTKGLAYWPEFETPKPSFLIKKKERKKKKKEKVLVVFHERCVSLDHDFTVTFFHAK